MKKFCIDKDLRAKDKESLREIFLFLMDIYMYDIQC